MTQKKAQYVPWKIKMSRTFNIIIIIFFFLQLSSNKIRFLLTNIGSSICGKNFYINEWFAPDLEKY